MTELKLSDVPSKYAFGISGDHLHHGMIKHDERSTVDPRSQAAWLPGCDTHGERPADEG